MGPSVRVQQEAELTAANHPQLRPTSDELAASGAGVMCVSCAFEGNMGDGRRGSILQMINAGLGSGLGHPSPKLEPHAAGGQPTKWTVSASGWQWTVKGGPVTRLTPSARGRTCSSTKTNCVFQESPVGDGSPVSREPSPGAMHTSTYRNLGDCRGRSAFGKFIR